MIDASRLRIGPEPRSGAALRRVPVQDFSRRFEALKRLDLARATEQRVFDAFSRAYHGYVTRSAIIGSNGVFRARRNAGVELFEDASELWYPPAALASRGRFNAANESRFYASSEFHGAVFEMLPKPGDRLTVLVAGAVDHAATMELAHVGIERAVVDREITGTMGDGLRNDADFRCLLDAMGIARRWRALDDFLTEIGTTAYPSTEAAARYKLTVAAAEFLLHGGSFGGLIYPSVGIDLRGFNLCLEPSAADARYAPFEAFVIEVLEERVVGYDQDSLGLAFGIRVLRRSTAIATSGRIDWGGETADVDPHLIASAIRRSGRE